MKLFLLATFSGSALLLGGRYLYVDYKYRAACEEVKEANKTRNFSPLDVDQCVRRLHKNLGIFTPIAY